MASSRSAKKLATYTARQSEPRWHSEYQPAIRATRQEAPRISRPTILHSALLGREVHLLSTPEAHAALLALHHPALFDLHEQKLLSCVPATHPLFHHPYCEGESLPGVEGTVKVAQRLGMLARHPKFFDSSPGGGWVPLPYVGDLLLYLRDEAGPYAVNWTIKLTPDDFLRRGPRAFGGVRSRKPDPDAELRHRLEAEYYADAGIRTVRVTGTELDSHLIANLRELFGWHRRATDVGHEAQLEVLAALQEYIGKDTIAFDVIRDVSRRLQIDIYPVKTLFHQLVWRRHLRVDLYRPLLMDRPIHHEVRDPISAHYEWFRR